MDHVISHDIPSFIPKMCGIATEHNPTKCLMLSELFGTFFNLFFSPNSLTTLSESVQVARISRWIFVLLEKLGQSVIVISKPPSTWHSHWGLDDDRERVHSHKRCKDRQRIMVVFVFSYLPFERVDPNCVECV